ncbi:hypothetical protein [Fluviicola taffensis]|uniref:Uncharacterized protein n=1 Tax=Fluviicola taffensis (strain DSM 16823 / NCIMB 13979 / RW262) TaxID=755732 RepID=F2IFN7_FLUTR|nr:hypothetical protein [Fluviicola taffensis]AEA42495.1 hypothetical protein Fluta_0490 [Fluviicola taffensis DSM 16823]
MTSERIVLLSILTACIYATTIFAESGVFLLPFGLFKPALFLIASILVIVNKRFGWQEIMLLLATFSLALSSHVLIQIVVPHHTLMVRKDGIETFTTFALLAFTLLFFVWQVLIAWKDRTQFRWLQIINGLVMLACLWMNLHLWIIVPTIMWLLSVFLSRNENSLHKSFAGLYGFFIISCWVSGVFFGADAILQNL